MPLAPIAGAASTVAGASRASKWDVKPATAADGECSESSSSSSSSPDAATAAGAAAAGAAGAAAPGARAGAAAEKPRAGTGSEGKGQGKGKRKSAPTHGRVQISQVCFFHNPAKGKVCTRHNCLREHLNTRRPEQMDRFYRAIDAHRTFVFNSTADSRNLARSPSPPPRGGGRRSSAGRRSRGRAARSGGRSSPRHREGSRGGGGGRSRTLAVCDRAESSEERGQREGSAGDGGVASGEPGEFCFRSFMRSQPSDVTPAAALAAFRPLEAQRKQRSALEFFEAHKGDGILADAHRGIHLLRAFDWRIISTRRAAAAFVADLKAGAFAGLSLLSDCHEDKRTVLGSGGLCSAALPGPPGVGPHFLADPGCCSMVFASVGASPSVWDLHELLRGQPGFVDVWLGEPAPQSLLREGRARFQSAAQLEAAIQKLDGTVVKGYAMKLDRAAPQEEHRVVLAPPAASEPAHVKAVNDLAKAIVEALDEAFGLPEAGTRELLEARPADMEAQLDLRALYLRRVHHFCLYSTAWCADERDLLQHCGAACLRTKGQAWDGERAWAEEQLRGLRRFLAALPGLARPDPVPAVTEGVLGERWAAQCQESTKREGEGRFRCLKCSKLFKGEDYLQKHLLKAHCEGFCRLVLELRDEQMREAYQRAQRGPGW
eukprot:CAMPEP_0175503654 /NCGR_PEP_ID=MMETSP0096-20121207/7939_1 /TAXON_ID=311494 /ORGANISM="Alexandrium monilatum, Strain CCMP3105" /LENGTH=658 /DNA_ID=CAMNT_0016805715 /DNA_START=27 /DNA_END=2000 /DNA_ORIENTATION=+